MIRGKREALVIEIYNRFEMRPLVCQLWGILNSFTLVNGGRVREGRVHVGLIKILTRLTWRCPARAPNDPLNQLGDRPIFHPARHVLRCSVRTVAFLCRFNLRPKRVRFNGRLLSARFFTDKGVDLRADIIV